MRAFRSVLRRASFALLASVPVGAVAAEPLLPTRAPGVEAPGAGDPVASAPKRVLNPLSTLDRESLSAFKGRPLFAPGRRPPALRQAFVPPPPVAMATPVPDLRLVGIVAGIDKAVAILRRNAGGPSLNVKVGDAVDTWRVQAITPDRVVLREGEREQTYRLFAAGGGIRPAP